MRRHEASNATRLAGDSLSCSLRCRLVCFLAGDGALVTQLEYIAILFNDCGYDTASHRKGWLQRRFGVNFSDELDSRQRSLAIEELKEEKNAR